jgi:hypothetical protein
MRGPFPAVFGLREELLAVDIQAEASGQDELLVNYSPMIVP